MKFHKKVGMLALSVAAAVVFSFGTLFVQAEDAPQTVGGWYNAGNGASQITQQGEDISIDLRGNTSFGSSFVLNDELAADKYGGFTMQFDLDISLTNNEEVWVSAVPLYDEEAETIHRVGLHFISNDWMNIAIYGTLGGTDKSFAYVVEKSSSFPALTDTIRAEIRLEYDADFHAIETLKLNGTQIYQQDLTELYENEYFLFSTDSVGFDAFVNTEEAVISNVRVEALSTEYSWHRASVNNYYSYAKTADEFTSRRLSAQFDTQDEVRAFTENATLLAGMFAGGLSHNYVFTASVREMTASAGSEIGFYVWYQNLNNYILLSSTSEGTKMEAVLNGTVVGSVSSDTAIGQGDSVEAEKYSNLGQTSVSVQVNGSEIFMLEELTGFDENYYVGLYAKNVAATLEDISTLSFYVPYDFVTEGDWITSGYSETAWNTEGETLSVELNNEHSADGFRTWSVAVMEKVVNDTQASYTPSITLSVQGDHAYGMVPYYQDSANYVMLGVQSVGGAYSLIAVYSQEGVVGTKNISAPSDTSMTVRRDGTKFTLEAGGTSLEVTLDGLTDISEYCGYFVSGKGTAQIGALTFEGFESFRLYEQENGWTTSSVQKDDIVFDESENTITINGNYTDAGLTDGTDQRLAMAIREESFRNDYVIEVELTKTIEPSGSCQREGVVAWYLDENNYFVIFIDQWTVWEAFQVNACGVYNGERMVDTSFNDYAWFLGSKDTPGYIDQTFTLRVLRNGQTFKAWVNDVLIFSRTFDKAEYDLTVYDDDEAYLGVFAAGIGTEFKNYTVRAMTSEEGTPTPSAGNRPVTESPDTPDPTPGEEEQNPGKEEGGGCSGSVSGQGLSAVILSAGVIATVISAIFIGKRRKN